MSESELREKGGVILELAKTIYAYVKKIDSYEYNCQLYIRGNYLKYDQDESEYRYWFSLPGLIGGHIAEINDIEHYLIRFAVYLPKFGWIVKIRIELECNRIIIFGKRSGGVCDENDDSDEDLIERNYDWLPSALDSMKFILGDICSKLLNGELSLGELKFCDADLLSEVPEQKSDFL